MGRYFEHIYIERGLKAVVKGQRPQRKKRGRAHDEMTVITVRDMPVGVAVGGEITVRSSNAPGAPQTISSEWSGNAREALTTRLRDGNGGPKGRVLYAMLRTVDAEVPAAALCYHLPRAGEIEVKALLAPRDLTEHRGKLFQALLLVAERVAFEHSGGKKARLTLEVARSDARWYRHSLGFRDAGRADQKSRVVLCREGDPRELQPNAS